MDTQIQVDGGGTTLTIGGDLAHFLGTLGLTVVRKDDLSRVVGGVVGPRWAHQEARDRLRDATRG